ncbi:GMC family oxidoreductase [Oceanospirillum maris]|uniref:GMC family oxidoreductase n=1 Tax=Oceanospirillum maris TaxID=64977 RepID=UPI000418D5C2|nr:GMC family oxidoreductase N-terminal domain-containing protein [Oceanospirillum maris]
MFNNKNKLGEAIMDYVIVGGGAAGCLLAERLSRDKSCQVTLIEAGTSDRNPLIHIPAGILALMRSKRFNWSLYTEPQSELNQRQLFWPRGKTLGGSSSINAMCYTRGQQADFDHWADVLGCDDGNIRWGYQDLLPHFKGMESFEAGANFWHGDNGPLNVQALRCFNPLSAAYLIAGQQFGLPLNGDFNGAVQAGVGAYHVMQRNGSRCSSAKAFLDPAYHRDNLTVITKAQVQRLKLRKQQVCGVYYQVAGLDLYLPVAGEVILAAGALHSPQILMLSGIGPEKALAEQGINVHHKLEGVGQNLQDHLDISVSWLEKGRRGISLNPLFWPRGLKGVLDYQNRTGVLTSNFAEAGAFLATDTDHSRPDIQHHFIPALEVNHGLNLTPTFRHFGYTLRACLLRPKSRGYIGLRSSNAADAPRLQPCYLAEPEDMAGMIRALDSARELLNQPEMARFGRKEWLPGKICQTRADKEAYIRQYAESIYHPVGTCKMGQDDKAVVNLALQVHGIDNLRVVDASVMPTLVSGNTTAATLAIASKAAEIIVGT